MKNSKSTQKQVALKYGFRSGLEEKVAEELRIKGVDFKYEELTLEYVKPSKTHKYTPDFVLPNAIIIETKGRFITADRQKLVLVKNQHPDLDIRLVFSNSRAKINKNSQTTYADWAKKNGFKYADKSIPDAWLEE